MEQQAPFSFTSKEVQDYKNINVGPGCSSAGGVFAWRGKPWVQSPLMHKQGVVMCLLTRVLRSEVKASLSCVRAKLFSYGELYS